LITHKLKKFKVKQFSGISHPNIYGQAGTWLILYQRVCRWHRVLLPCFLGIGGLFIRASATYKPFIPVIQKPWKCLFQAMLPSSATCGQGPAAGFYSVGGILLKFFETLSGSSLSGPASNSSPD
jgi:hypothetical protein